MSIRTGALQFRGVSSWITTIMLIENCGAAAVNDEDRECRILELYGNSGIDVGKFERFSFRRKREKEGTVVAVDGDMLSLNQERKRWDDKRRPYKGEFHTFREYVDAMQSHETYTPGTFDCAVSFHHGMERHFGSEHEAREFVHLIAENLREGGVFMGTMADMSALHMEMERSGKMDVETGRWTMHKGLFNVEIFATVFHSYGTRYELSIVGEETNPYEKYLVHVPSLVHLCHEHGLELVHCTNYDEFYEDYKHLYLEHLKAYNVFSGREKNPNLEIEEGQRRLMRLYTTFMFRKRPKADTVRDTLLEQ